MAILISPVGTPAPFKNRALRVLKSVPAAGTGTEKNSPYLSRLPVLLINNKYIIYIP